MMGTEKGARVSKKWGGGGRVEGGGRVLRFQVSRTSISSNYFIPL